MANKNPNPPSEDVLPSPSLTEKIGLIWKRFNSQLINRLLLRFVGLMALFYLVWASPLVQRTFVTFIAKAYAKAGGILLNIMGYGVEVNQDIISSNAFSISIKNGCDGIEGLAIFLCAIAIYPASIAQKIKGLGWGIVFLVLLNLLRIVTLYMTGIHLPNLFDLMHESIWQILFIALTIVALFVWIDSLNKDEKDLSH